MNIFQSTDPQDVTQLSQCLSAMAMHCYRYSLYNQSIEHSIKDLEINRRMYPTNHPNLINILYHIAGCYNQLNDYQQTFDYLKEIWMILKTNPDIYADHISMIGKDINRVVVKAAENHIELPWEIKIDQNQPVMVEKSTKPCPQWAMPKSLALRQAFGYE